MKHLTRLLEQHFFLMVSHRLHLNPKDTEHHLKEMHQYISTEKKQLSDYSTVLQKSYDYYLYFLGIDC